MSWLLSLLGLLTLITQGKLELHNESFKLEGYSKQYYCESLPRIEFDVPILANEGKRCRFRNEGLFPIDIFRWRSGGGCMSYIASDWLIKPYNMSTCVRTVDNVVYKFPVGRIGNVAFFFDYEHKKYTAIIASLFKTRDLYLKWESCARNGDKCCRNTMTEQNVQPSVDYPCPAIWDAWTCFLPAKPDTISEEPCPDYTSSSNNTPCILYSQKECFTNGTWNQQTEYGTCASAPVYRRRHNFHVIVLYVSIALSFPAVLIFISYKNLRILRVNLHRNLLIACILRNMFTVISKEVVLLDSLKPSNETNYVMENNGVPCRMIAYFSSVFANAIYACMLVDGFYLHKLIVRVFAPDPNAYIIYGVTAVLSFLPTTIWAILVAVDADEHCWMVDSFWYQWIPDGFRIAILSINIILLGDIIRALLTKLKKNTSAQHTKSTLKAMALLIPLFGVPFILTANRDIVDNDSCTAGDIYYYVSYLIQALQGIMVAILFCYWNKEVHTQIKGTYRKLNLQYENRYGSKNGRRTTTNRRETAATYVHNSVVPKHDSFNKALVEEDNNKRISDWLTENKQGDSGPPPLEPAKNKSQMQFSDAAATSNNINQANPFDRVSKYIDENSDSNQEQTEPTLSNEAKDLKS